MRRSTSCRVALLDHLIPGLAGELHVTAPSTYQRVITVVAIVGLAALVVWTVARRQGAWRAWTFFAVMYLAHMGLLAWGRLGLYDVDQVASDLQYYADVAALFLVTLALVARCPVRAAGRGVRAPVWAGPAALGALAVLLAANLHTSWSNYLGGATVFRASKAYARTTRAELEALRRQGTPVGSSLCGCRRRSPARSSRRTTRAPATAPSSTCRSTSAPTPSTRSCRTTPAGSATSARSFWPAWALATGCRRTSSSRRAPPSPPDPTGRCAPHQRRPGPWSTSPCPSGSTAAASTSPSNTTPPSRSWPWSGP